MSDATIGVLGLIVIGIMLCFSMPVALVFGAVGFIGMIILIGFGPALNTIAAMPVGVTLNYTWTTMPMFVMMGYFAYQSGIVDECYAGFRVWFGRIRGGLAHTVILGNAAFGAVSGSGIAAALTFCAVSLPEMRKNNYDDRLSIGSIGAGTLMAGLIPPSLPFIVFGGLTNTSIGELFIAGVIPGLVLCFLYLLSVSIQCRLNPALGPPAVTVRSTLKDKLTVPPGLWIIISVFAILLIGLYMGVFTPTEGGACAAFLIMIVGLVRRKLSLNGIKEAATKTAFMAGMFFLILIGVMIFNRFIVFSGLNDLLTSSVAKTTDSPIVLLFIVAAMYMVFGTFLDAAAVVMITVPMIFPVATEVGVDPLALGVVVTLSSTLGSLTPPYGTTIFAMRGVLKDVSVPTIYRGIMPFYIPVVLGTILFIFFPQLSNWLPSMMK